MNYKEAIEYIHGMKKLGSKLGLQRIEALLELMGNPHKKLKYVHIAGTNGKGSTAAFISSILCEAGYKTGIFTSPYIHRFSERIRINGDEILEGDIARLCGVLKENADKLVESGMGHPTVFELVTAMAFQYFFEQRCDIVVLEVGMGGRLDSTNVIAAPEAAVITTISYDHTDFLGTTLPQIAFEKAGIIKENSEVVLYPQEGPVEKVFETIGEQKRARLHKVEFSSLVPRSFDIRSQEFDYGGYKSLSISLLGSHQLRNAAVAIKTAEILKQKGYVIPEDVIRKGLAKAKWPGRLEVVNEAPFVLIDGAHNVEGAGMLVDNLQKYFPGKTITFIAGVLADKEYQAMMKLAAPIASRFITVTPNNSRALSAMELAVFLRDYCGHVLVGERVDNAVRLSLSLCSKEDVVCAFGSLYYIGEVREYFGLK